MFKLLTDAGAQITKELYELAINSGAHKISKIIAEKLGIQERIERCDRTTKILSSDGSNKSADAYFNFNYNVNEDSKVLID